MHGHTCAKKQFLLLVVEGDDFGSEWVNFELQHIEVTACVFFGTPTPKSIKAMKVHHHRTLITHVELIKLIKEHAFSEYFHNSLLKLKLLSIPNESCCVSPTPSCFSSNKFPIVVNLVSKGGVMIGISMATCWS